MLRIDALRCSPRRDQPETRCAQTSGCFFPFLAALLSASAKGLNTGDNAN